MLSPLCSARLRIASRLIQFRWPRRPPAAIIHHWHRQSSSTIYPSDSNGRIWRYGERHHVRPDHWSLLAASSRPIASGVDLRLNLPLGRSQLAGLGRSRRPPVDPRKRGVDGLGFCLLGYSCGIASCSLNAASADMAPSRAGDNVKPLRRPRLVGHCVKASAHSSRCSDASVSKYYFATSGIYISWWGIALYDNLLSTFTERRSLRVWCHSSVWSFPRARYDGDDARLRVPDRQDRSSSAARCRMVITAGGSS